MKKQLASALMLSAAMVYAHAGTAPAMPAQVGVTASASVKAQPDQAAPAVAKAAPAGKSDAAGVEKRKDAQPVGKSGKAKRAELRADVAKAKNEKAAHAAHGKATAVHARAKVDGAALKADIKDGATGPGAGAH